jgi:hypothetical protein
MNKRKIVKIKALKPKRKTWRRKIKNMQRAMHRRMSAAIYAPVVANFKFRGLMESINESSKT